MKSNAANKIIDIRTRLLWHGGIEHALWSALNMLEAALCTLDDDGQLSWHFRDNKIFAADNLPNNLEELGNEIGIDDLKSKLFSAPIIDNTRKLSFADIGFVFSHDLENQFLTIQKLSHSINNDAGDDPQAKALASALDDGRIILYRQPIVCAKTFKPIRYECLARMQKQDGNIALPYEFIPAAESSGLIKNLDIHALKLAANKIKTDNSQKLSTNVSFATICDAGARSEILEILRNSKLNDKSLTVEITETIAIHDFDIAANFAQELNKLGIRLSLDDFGAGHTSFKSLRELALDEVKIDGQYISNIENRKDAYHFVSAINAIASDLGIECVAERVETIEERDTLTSLNLDAFQGYLFGKPAF